MTRRPTAVLSRGLSRNPEKRALEEQLLAYLRDEVRLATVVVPNLYDLHPDGAAVAELRRVTGNMIVLSWMYPRGSHWILDFHGIDGQVGKTQLTGAITRDESAILVDESSEDAEERVITSRPPRERKIYCLDLRTHSAAEPYLEEIRRIIDTLSSTSQPANHAAPPGRIRQIDEVVGRRWYPVIDFSRCTNCMECVDFCLFGVYGIDDVETILVELPDNCRKGCPACSRVCPEQAIIFPQHKTPAIAGAAVDNGSTKIDLSKLFGAPDDVNGATSQAERERDEQLRQAGLDIASPVTKQKDRPPQPRDELDDLIDELDDVDL